MLPMNCFCDLQFIRSQICSIFTLSEEHGGLSRR
jgi:hypothetical protein